MLLGHNLGPHPDRLPSAVEVKQDLLDLVVMVCERCWLSVRGVGGGALTVLELLSKQLKKVLS